MAEVAVSASSSGNRRQHHGQKKAAPYRIAELESLDDESSNVVCHPVHAA